MFEDLRKTAEPTRLGRRSIEMVGSVKYEDIEPVQFAILEDMLSNGILRTDRPMPSVGWQIKRVKSMNESDADWIERLAYYKKDIELKFTESISLTDYQQGWFDYIRGKSDDKPGGNVETELSEVPF